MQEDKFKRNLYKNSRMTIDFFMYGPTALYQEKISSYTLNCNPVILIKRINLNSMNDSYNEKETFKVNPRNLFRVTKFFNTIIKWFTDPEKIDLFMRDDDNNLIFNADYNKLSTDTGYKKNDSGIMKAIPTVVDLSDGKAEGINLYINNFSGIIQLTLDEIAIIYELFRHLRFSEEISNTLLEFYYVKATGNIETDVGKWNNSKGTAKVSKSPMQW